MSPDDTHEKISRGNYAILGTRIGKTFFLDQPLDVIVRNEELKVNSDYKLLKLFKKNLY